MKRAKFRPAPSKKKVEFSYTCTIGLMMLLIVYYIFLLTFRIWPVVPWASLLIFLSPLLLFLYALVKNRRPKTAVWLCFIVNPYFCHGVLLAFSMDLMLSLLGIIESLLIVSLFSSSMLFSRWQSQANSPNHFEVNKNLPHSPPTPST